MEKRIAIIIPAYKKRFLRQTLDSIAIQTNREFTVYIGDDASPHDLAKIVFDYMDKMDIVYRRFENNLGKTDLPGHWERCINLSHEPVIWFFSDDDLMPQDGVERILKAIENCGIRQSMFRFPLSIVDAYNKILYENPPLLEGTVSSYQFLLDKLEGRVCSAACEYVFCRDAFNQSGGFVKFPLAWCSDDATWVRLSDYTAGMIMLPGKPVCWRNVENENISCSDRFDKEKLVATGLFLNWIVSRYPQKLADKKLQHAIKKYSYTILHYSLNDRYGLCELLKIGRVLWDIRPAMALSVVFRMSKLKLKRKNIR